MLVGMKNAIELLGDLSSYYDFAINEECWQWNECGVSLLACVAHSWCFAFSYVGSFCSKLQ